MKKSLSIIFAVLLLLNSSLAAKVWAEDEVKADDNAVETVEEVLEETELALASANVLESGSASTDGSVSYVLYDDGELVISGNGEIKNYPVTGSIVSTVNKSKVKKVTIEEGVTRLGDYALYDLSNVEVLLLPDTLESIGADTINMSFKLKELNVPKSVIAIDVVNFNGTFCNLDSITVSSENAKYSSPNNAVLYDKTTNTVLQGTKAAYIPEGTITIGDNAFTYVETTNNLIIPSSVRTIGDAFGGAKFNAVYIPSSVSSISNYAFGLVGYELITEIYTDFTNEAAAVAKYGTNWNPLGLAVNYGYSEEDFVLDADCIEHGFANDEGTIRYVLRSNGDLVLTGTGIIRNSTASEFGIIPGNEENNYNTLVKRVIIGEGITKVGNYAFINLLSVEEISLPSTLTDIGMAAFHGTQLIHSLNIPKNTVQMNVTNSFISAARYLEYITVESGNLAFSDGDGSNVLMYKNGGNWKVIKGSKNSVIPDYTVEIGDYAFYKMEYNIDLYIPDSVTKIGGYAFQSSKLHSIYIPSSVTTLSQYALFETSSNTLIFTDVASAEEAATKWGNGWNSSGLKVYYGYSPEEYNFFLCTDYKDLETIVIPEGIERIPDDWYSRICKFTAKKVILPDSCKTIGKYAFQYSKIEEIDLNKVETVEMQGMFLMSDLKTIHIPATLKSVGANFLRKCKSLESVTVDPANVHFSSPAGSNVLIDDNGALIAGCKNSVIPAEAEYIATYAFDGIDGLTFIRIPSTIEVVTSSSFFGCKDLEEVYIDAGVSEVASKAFRTSNKDLIVYIGSSTVPSSWNPDWNLIDEATGDRALVVAGVYPTYADYVYWTTTDFGRDNHVIIPDGITAIPNSAFEGLADLEYIYIPSSVTSVGNNVFKGLYAETVVMTESDASLYSDGWLEYKSGKNLPLITNVDPSEIENVFLGANDWGSIVAIDRNALIAKGLTALSVKEELWVAGLEESYQYTGLAITPSVRVYHHKTLLKEGIDYTIKYSNNTKVADSSASKAPTITVTGKGMYTGKAIDKFSIASKNLTGLTIPNIVVKATGKAIVPKVNIVVDGKTLKAGTDYDLLKDSVPFTSVSETGSYNVDVVFKGNYTGSTTLTYIVSEGDVVGGSIAKAVVTGIDPSYSYNFGNPITPAVTVTLNGVELVKDVDYQVTYSKNINKGTASVVIAGINNFNGSIKKSFKIEAVNINDLNVRLNNTSLNYSKNGAIPNNYFISYTYVKNGITYGGSLKEGVDYTIKVTNNKAVADSTDLKAPTVTFTGKGNYVGSVAKTFNIKKMPINNSTIKVVAPNIPVSTKLGGWKSTKITVMEMGPNGKAVALKLNTDYELTYLVQNEGEWVDATTLDPFTLPVGSEVRLKVTAKDGSNYTSAADGSYQIVEANMDISKASFKIANKEYTGSEITLDKSEIVATLNKAPLDLNAFEIVGCANNIKKGTATVYLVGNKAYGYGGYKAVSFKIGAKNITGSGVGHWWDIFR